MSSVRGFAEQPTKIELADLQNITRSIENSRKQLDEIATLIPPACEITYEDYLTTVVG